MKFNELVPDFSYMISEGSFGDIYKVKNYDDIVVKIIKKSDKINSGETNRNIIKKIDKHDNLLHIYGNDKKKYGNINLIYMEYVDGLNLFEFTKKYTINDKILYNIIFQILSALCYLHKNKITHRDIKLENIIININNFHIKLIDYGLSCYGYPCKNLVGTSGYFAPEMIYSIDKYDSKCDIWSLGCVLYYLICKYFPFIDIHNKEKYIAQLKNRKPIIYKKTDWIKYNIVFNNLCKKMLIYDFKNRINSFDSYEFLNIYYPLHSSNSSSSSILL
jgi:calcium-dependent protein kinase